MIEAMEPQLHAWAADDAMAAVVIQGAGDRAFCAGGDIRDLYDKRGSRFRADYYAAEYTQNVTIFNYPKPYIALMDGVVVMGGGFGVSIHGSHRVVTERTLFAMPETGIGLFPDIGASWFLPRCPGELGMYLGLTGTACAPPIACMPGSATSTSRRTSLDDGSRRAGQYRQPTAASSAPCLSNYSAGDPGPNKLAEHRDGDRPLFAGDNREAILARLAAEGTAWAQRDRGDHRHPSPTSLKVTFELRIGATLAGLRRRDGRWNTALPTAVSAAMICSKASGRS